MRHTHATARRPLGLRTITDPDTGRRYPVPTGGADDEGGRLEELHARLDSETEPLTDEELAELEELAVAAFDEADAEDDPDLDAMEELHGVIARTRSVADEREAEAEQRRQRAAELRDGIHATDEDADEDADDDPEASDDDAEDDDAEGSVEVPDSPEGIEDHEPEAVAASSATPAGQPQRPSLRAASARRRQGGQPQPKRSRGLSVVTAGDVPGRSAGTRLESLRDVGEAFADKASAVMRGRNAGRFGVATFALDFPEERRLTSDIHANERLVDSVVAGAQAQDIDALVAAGGLCAPVDVAYDLEGVSVESRPVRDALVRFEASRGGIRFLEPPTLSDLDDAVGVWTEENDQDPGGESGPATKAIQRIDCGEEVEVLVEAITKGLEIGNFSRRTFPEQFSRFWQLAGAAHSRLAENQLWTAMADASTAVTFDRQLGAARDILTLIDTAVAAYRSRHRMADNAVLRLTAPSWVRNLMRADVTKQLPGDSSLSRTDAEIAQWFTDRAVAVTWSPDAAQVFGAQAEGALEGFPGEVEFLLHHEGAFVFLDGGTLDFGMEVRDSSLNAVNDVQAFMETFEGVAFRGVESLHITATVEPTGETAGTVDTEPEEAT